MPSYNGFDCLLLIS